MKEASQSAEQARAAQVRQDIEAAKDDRGGIVPVGPDAGISADIHNASPAGRSPAQTPRELTDAAAAAKRKRRS